MERNILILTKDEEMKSVQSMHEMVMPKVAVLKKLKANRKVHHKVYKEAAEGYKDELLKELRDVSKAVKNDEEYNLEFSPRPECHLESYDRAISMLEMTKEPSILMTSEDYSRYVLDEWNWKYNWTTVTSNYMNKK